MNANQRSEINAFSPPFALLLICELLFFSREFSCRGAGGERWKGARMTNDDGQTARWIEFLNEQWLQRGVKVAKKEKAQFAILF